MRRGSPVPPSSASSQRSGCCPCPRTGLCSPPSCCRPAPGRPSGPETPAGDLKVNAKTQKPFRLFTCTVLPVPLLPSPCWSLGEELKHPGTTPHQACAPCHQSKGSSCTPNGGHGRPLCTVNPPDQHLTQTTRFTLKKTPRGVKKLVSSPRAGRRETARRQAALPPSPILLAHVRPGCGQSSCLSRFTRQAHLKLPSPASPLRRGLVLWPPLR